MTTPIKLKIAGALVPVAAVLAFAAPALAVEVSTGTSAAITTAGAEVRAGVKAEAKLTAAETKAVEKASAQIDARVARLTEFSARMGNMKLVTAEAKASLSATVAKTIADLTALKAKIAADTTAAEIRADMQAVTATNRVYALIMPKLHILVAVERANLIAEMMAAFNTKIQPRIDAARTEGKDVTAIVTTQAHMEAQLADVKLQTTAAVGYVSNLQPDNGDKTVLASNNAALAKARADLRVAESDLKAARKDIMTIIMALKAFGDVSVSASATTR